MPAPDDPPTVMDYSWTSRVGLLCSHATKDRGPCRRSATTGARGAEPTPEGTRRGLGPARIQQEPVTLPLAFGAGLVVGVVLAELRFNLRVWRACAQAMGDDRQFTASRSGMANLSVCG